MLNTSPPGFVPGTFLTLKTMAQSNFETAIKSTTGLLQYGDIVKDLYGEKYKDELKPYIGLLKEVMTANNCDVINALILMSKTSVYQENSSAQIMFMAALLEIIEYSENK